MNHSLFLLTATLVLLGSAARAQQGPIAPDIKREALWDGRKIVPFKALDNPPTVASSEAGPFLGDEEYVLGITVNGESRAYPTRFAWFHHIINDTVGKVPVAITYCSVCNSGMAFDRTLDKSPVLIDFYGLYNGIACYSERATGSVLLQLDGRFVTGALLGKTLKVLPVLDTTWGKWKALHPDTRLMSPETEFQRAYRPKGNAEMRGYDRFPLPFFKQSMTRTDKRLPLFDKVLAVSVGEKRRAYPVASLTVEDGVINDTLGDLPIAVLFEPETATAIALAREIDGKSLTFVRKKLDDGTGAFVDRQTGTRWNIAGKGEAGPLAGKQLTVLDNHLSQWYGWSAYFPDTSIYGRSDPPQPGDPKDL
jgi:hypothetical protein